MGASTSHMMRGSADISKVGSSGQAMDGGADSSWPSMFQAVAVGAVFGLVMALSSAPAMASNEASGYREADQSIISYNGNKAIGAKTKKQADMDGFEKASKLFSSSKLTGLSVTVAPEAQITLDELKQIDPPKKK